MSLPILAKNHFKKQFKISYMSLSQYRPLPVPSHSHYGLSLYLAATLVSLLLPHWSLSVSLRHHAAPPPKGLCTCYIISLVLAPFTV